MKNIGYQFIIVILSLINIFLNFETLEKKDSYNVRVSEGYTNIGLPTNPIKSGFTTNKLPIQSQPVQNSMNVPPVLKEEAFLSAAFDYSLGDARLVGEAGVMKTDIALSINPIEDNELPPLNQGMVNVTGDNSGYRMLPKGMVFRDDINIILPYDSTLLPMGFTPNDIKSYYYHDSYKRWIEIERDSIDENNQLVISKVNHFTDFINAVLKTPEMPETSAYTPTQMNDIKMANPMEGMTLVSPPSSNSMGSTNLNYPIWIPNGRNGMQPNLSVSYNGGQASSWLGVGWDISIPTITVETRWGVPRFDPIKESETYILNGEQLVTKDENEEIEPLVHRTNIWKNRNANINEQQYFPRVNLSFDSIVRHGTNPSNYWWSVTDRTGVTHYYGKQKNQDAVDYNSVMHDASGNIVHWGLTESIDLNGNVVSYYYSKTNDRGVPDPSASMGYNMYIDSINYTGHKTASSYTHGIQTVVFVRSNGREDVTINGNYGFKMVDQCLLCKLYVQFYGPEDYNYESAFEIDGNGILIGYEFVKENNRNSKYKTRLKDIYRIDAKVDPICTIFDTTAFNGTRTHFDYNDYPTENQLFGSAETIPCTNDYIESLFSTALFDVLGLFKSTALGASTGMSWGLGGNAFIGLGSKFGESSLSVGGNFDYNRSSTEGLLSLIDLNGDGLVDKVYRKKDQNNDWQVYFRKQLPQPISNSIFGPEILLENLSSFLSESSDNISWGLQASAGLSYSGSWSRGWSWTTVYFSDVNADGLPDLITEEGVLFNSIDPVSKNPYFRNIYKEQAENQTITNPEYIVTSASEPCGGIIFDGEVDENLICEISYEFDTIIKFVYYIDSVIMYNTINNFIATREDYGYHQIINNYTNDDHIHVYFYKKVILCEPQLRDPDIDAVRVWVTPKAGQITLNSVFSLVQDLSYSRKQSRFVNGVRYSIEICDALSVNNNYELVPLTSNTLIHSEVVYEGDYTDHNSSFSIYVPANSIIFFRLQSNGNRDFDKVNWEQTIEYTSGTLQGEVYNSENDFLVSGDYAFSSIDDGEYDDATVTINATINSGSLNNHSAALWIFGNNQNLNLMIPITPNMTNSQISPITLSQFLPGEYVKFMLLTSADKDDPILSNIIIKPHIQFTPNNAPVNGNTVRGTVNYYPNVVYAPLVQIPTNRIDTVYRALFGPLYRGWGHFGYNNNYPNALITDLINVATLKKDFTFFNDDQQEVEDNIEAVPGNQSDEEKYMRATFAQNEMYDPLTLNTRWIEVYPDNKNQQWFGYGMINYFTDTQISNTRTPNNIAHSETIDIPVFDNPIPFPPQTESNITLVSKTIRKQNLSKSKGKSWGAAVLILSYGESESTNESQVKTDYIDLNGDRYPDFVGQTGAQYSKPWGGIGEFKSFAHTGHTLSISTSKGNNFGASYPFMKKEVTNSDNSKTTTAGNGSPSVNLGEGNDHTVFTFNDINGDGLPDKLLPNGKVMLNLGYNFSIPEMWNTTIIRTGESENEGTSFGGGLGQQLKQGFDISQKSISAGVGVSESKNSSTQLMIDINCDGLPDIVKDLGASIQVYYNNGDGSFSLPDNISNISSIDYGISFSENINLALTYGMTYAYFKFGFGINGSPYNQSFSKDKVQFVDFDGDGCVDQVSSDDENALSIKYNLSGKTNLLKTVTNFTGSTISLEYDKTKLSYESPNSSYVLTKVETFDPYSPVGGERTLTEFEYKNPYYNRLERTSYGFDTVITRQFDTENNNILYRYIVQGFDNDSFLKKGTKKSETICDANHHVYVETLYNVAVIDPNGFVINDDGCPKEAFPVLECEIVKYYEGLTTPGIITTKCYQYDGKRNVIKYTNYVDYASNVVDDNIIAEIEYLQGRPNNQLSLVSAIRVYGVNQYNLVREKTAEYDNIGRIKKINQHSEIGIAEIDLEYDIYGNITKITYPEDVNHQRLWYAYDYDNLCHMYPVRITDVLGFHSYSAYDYRFGKPNRTEDINGNVINYHYDWIGRLRFVKAPNEASLSTGSLLMSYYPANYSTWNIFPQSTNVFSYASTSHYDFQIQDYGMKTTTICDAFGRVIQTKKDGEVGGQDVTLVSGKVTYDAFGRAIQQYHPFNESLSTNPLSYNSYYDPSTISTTTYDILDRELSLTLPNSTQTLMQYGFGNDAFGIKRFKTTTIDANANVVETYTDPRKLKTTLIADNNVTTTFKYSALGELQESIDPNGHPTNYEYNKVGQLVRRHHPDAGLTSSEYDLAGHVISKTTQDLENNNMSIVYSYNYNQLLSVRYPKYPANDVVYYYGDNSAQSNRKGRLWAIEDASGRQEFSFGAMGEVIENIRTFATPIDDYTYTFGMQFSYDTWNRVKSIVYPDGEQVDYSYNSGGGLKSVVSNYGGNSYTYITDIQYNDFEQKTYLEYGNGAYTGYTYDILQRLSTLTSVSNQGTMQSISYVYDNVSNIDSVSNTAMPLNNGLGAQYFQKHNYDNLYRLTNSRGNWHVSNGFSGIYNLNLKYFDDGRIKSKTQYAEQLYTNTLGAISYSNNYYYSQNQVHTLDNVEDQITNTTYNFRYDANGNLAYQTNPSYDERFLCWDEENRLMGVSDMKYSSYYMYDHAGERTYKITGINNSMNINGYILNHAILKEATLFTSPYLVATDQGYTKHYYSGSERIASSIGKGGLSIIDQPLNLEKDTWYHKFEVSKNQASNVIYFCTNRGFDFGNSHLQDVLYNAINTQNDPMEQYFYHPDHLGSTSWITDRNGDAIQYLHYLPFGEEWIDQRSTSWNAQYSFTGKIKDAETGYNYFGARYYDSGLSVWLSVDPLSDKYPTLSPYTYCANNPIMMVDPDGMRIDASVLYNSKYKNGKQVFGFVIKAMEYFASTKLGKAELAKYAEAGQTVFGVTFKKDGEFHKEGVDLFIGGETSASGDVKHKIENGRLQLTVRLSNTDNVASCLGTICHEMFIHCFQDSKDFIDNGELDFSYANKELKKVAKDRNRYDANFIQHWQDQLYWGRLTVYGISVLYKYHNKQIKKSELWKEAKSYVH